MGGEIIRTSQLRSSEWSIKPPAQWKNRPLPWFCRRVLSMREFFIVRITTRCIRECITVYPSGWLAIGRSSRFIASLPVANVEHWFANSPRDGHTYSWHIHRGYRVQGSSFILISTSNFYVKRYKECFSSELPGRAAYVMACPGFLRAPLPVRRYFSRNIARWRSLDLVPRLIRLPPLSRSTNFSPVPADSPFLSPMNFKRITKENYSGITACFIDLFFIVLGLRVLSVLFWKFVRRCGRGFFIWRGRAESKVPYSEFSTSVEDKFYPITTE